MDADVGPVCGRVAFSMSAADTKRNAKKRDVGERVGKKTKKRRAEAGGVVEKVVGVKPPGRICGQGQGASF